MCEILPLDVVAEVQSKIARQIQRKHPDTSQRSESPWSRVGWLRSVNLQVAFSLLCFFVLTVWSPFADGVWTPGDSR